MLAATTSARYSSRLLFKMSRSFRGRGCVTRGGVPSNRIAGWPWFCPSSDESAFEDCSSSRKGAAPRQDDARALTNLDQRALLTGERVHRGLVSERLKLGGANMGVPQVANNVQRLLGHRAAIGDDELRHALKDALGPDSAAAIVALLDKAARTDG